MRTWRRQERWWTTNGSIGPIGRTRGRPNNLDRFSSAITCTALPAVFVLDAAGTIRAKHVRGSKLEQIVEELVREREAGNP